MNHIFGDKRFYILLQYLCKFMFKWFYVLNKWMSIGTQKICTLNTTPTIILVSTYFIYRDLPIKAGLMILWDKNPILLSFYLLHISFNVNIYPRLPFVTLLNLLTRHAAESWSLRSSLIFFQVGDYIERQCFKTVAAEVFLGLCQTSIMELFCEKI